MASRTAGSRKRFQGRVPYKGQNSGTRAGGGEAAPLGSPLPHQLLFWLFQPRLSCREVRNQRQGLASSKNLKKLPSN